MNSLISPFANASAISGCAGFKVHYRQFLMLFDANQSISVIATIRYIRISNYLLLLPLFVYLYFHTLFIRKLRNSLICIHILRHRKSDVYLA